MVPNRQTPLAPQLRRKTNLLLSSNATLALQLRQCSLSVMREAFLRRAVLPDSWTKDSLESSPPQLQLKVHSMARRALSRNLQNRQAAAWSPE